MRFALLLIFLTISSICLHAQDTIHLSTQIYNSRTDTAPYVRRHIDILNLPAPCLVKVLSMEGKRVWSTLNWEAAKPLSWHLRDDRDQPLGTGLYYVHIVDSSGETIKILKLYYVGLDGPDPF